MNKRSIIALNFWLKFIFHLNYLFWNINLRTLSYNKVCIGNVSFSSPEEVFFLQCWVALVFFSLFLFLPLTDALWENPSLPASLSVHEAWTGSHYSFLLFLKHLFGIGLIGTRDLERNKYYYNPYWRKCN